MSEVQLSSGSSGHRFLSPLVKRSFALAGLAAVFELSGLGGLRSQAAVGWFATSALYALVMIICFRVYRRCEFLPMRLFWKMCTLTIALRSLGDLWTALQSIASSVIPQMPGDVSSAFYILGDVAVMYSMIVYPSIAETSQERTRVTLDALTVVMAAAGFGWLFLIGPHLAGEFSTGAFVLSLGQYVTSLLVTFAVIRVVMSRKRPLGAPAAYWGGAAIAVLSVTQISAPLAVDSSYMGLIFVGRIITVFLHVVSARAQEYDMRTKVDSLPRKPKRPFSILPYVAITALYSLLVVTLVRSTSLNAGTWGVLTIAIASTAVVVVRQLSAFGENARLLVEREQNLSRLDESYRREQESNRIRQQLEIELRQAQKLEALGKLSGGVAHEINTPLQYVRNNVAFLDESFQQLTGAVESYRRGENSDETDLDFLLTEVPSSLEDTKNGIDRVAEIVASLKSFGGNDVRSTSADINRILSDTLVIARAEVDRVADVAVEFGAIPMVVCQARDIGQVWLNLLLNAAHAIESSDRGRGQITVRTFVEDGSVIVEIEDNGSGMTPEVADHIFDPFFTTKAVGSGTGQGLTVVRSIVVDGHHGTINFSTHPGEGTTFRVALSTDSIVSGRTPERVSELQSE